jgi:hypothetical protein
VPQVRIFGPGIEKAKNIESSKKTYVEEAPVPLDKVEGFVKCRDLLCGEKSPRVGEGGRGPVPFVITR